VRGLCDRFWVRSSSFRLVFVTGVSGALFVVGVLAACVGDDPGVANPSGADGSSGGTGDGPPGTNGDGGSSSSGGDDGPASSDAPADGPPGPCSQQPTGAPVPNGLVGHWAFQGGSLVDLTARNGAATKLADGGAFSLEPDRFGCATSALVLTGGAGVDLGTFPSLVPAATAFSFQIWLKWRTSLNTQPRILSNETGFSNGNIGIYHSGETITLVTVHSSSNVTTESLKLTAQTWHQVVFVADQTHHQLYVDGEPLPIRTFTGFGVHAALTRTWRIGRLNDGYLFDGTVDDVRLYNRILSDGDVMTLYKEHGWPK
jgi:hypothetical protein